MRWNPYVLTTGDDQFNALWTDLGRVPTLVVLASGFDPRVPRVLGQVSEVAAAAVDVVRLNIDGGEEADSNMLAMASSNHAAVNAIVDATGATLTEQPYPDVHARRSAGLNISRAFHEVGHLERYSQVVVDISGLPRSVYFPLIRGILQTADSGWDGDLHVVACDSGEIDGAILEEGAENPSPLGGFSGPTLETQWAATVWLPVLGEGMSEQLASLLDAITPDEVVPILPFPARNPRRGDDLLIEHRELLLDRLIVEPRNFLYAAESNPFDLYRAVTDLAIRYQASLRPLGAARFVLSTHSSKLLSVGVLLSAYEQGLQVMHVSPSRYGIRAGVDLQALAPAAQPTDLWLTGQPYR
jgi:hypothetical protein